MHRHTTQHLRICYYCREVCWAVGGSLLLFRHRADRFSFCICVSGGVITGDSAVRLRTYLDTHGTLIGPLTNTVNGTAGMTVQQIIDYVAAEQPKVVCRLNLGLL